MSPYIDSAIQVGQNVVEPKKRHKMLEVSPKAFNSTIRTDNWRNEFAKINTLGSKKSIEAQMVHASLMVS